jgi:hypothetical protein
VRIPIPLLAVEFDFIARRRTEPFRFRLRTLLIATAVIAAIIYLLLPLSEADRRRMAIYEHLGSNEPDKNMNKQQIIEQLGPPSSVDPPSKPNVAAGCGWVATFETPLKYQKYELNLSFDDSDDMVIAWGLQKTEYQGLELLWFRLTSILAKIRLL